MLDTRQQANNSNKLIRKSTRILPPIHELQCIWTCVCVWGGGGGREEGRRLKIIIRPREQEEQEEHEEEHEGSCPTPLPPTLI